MATPVAIAYPDEQTAEQARATVWQLEQDLILRADQVAVITRDLGAKYDVQSSHSGISTAGGAIWGRFWGLPFGALFLIPFAGWAMGAVIKTTLSDEDTKKLQKGLQPAMQAGTSGVELLPVDEVA